MTNTEEIELGEWIEVYNRVGRCIGEYAVFESSYEKGSYTYSGYTYDKDGEVEWDLNGQNPDYKTPEQARDSAIDNVRNPD